MMKFPGWEFGWYSGMYLGIQLDCNKPNPIFQLWHTGIQILGGISSSVLSVFFTDNCYKLLKSLHLIGWEQICQWKTLTKRLKKCPPWKYRSHQLLKQPAFVRYLIYLIPFYYPPTPPPQKKSHFLRSLHSIIIMHKLHISRENILLHFPLQNERTAS